MSQLQQIKSLSNELSENALFSYSKRGILILMEILSWLITFGLIVLAFRIFNSLPDLGIEEGDKYYETYNNFQDGLNFLSLVCFCFAVFAFLISRYLRRMRRKKAQVYELTQLIKNL